MASVVGVEEFELQPTVRRPSYMVALDQPMTLGVRLEGINVNVAAGVGGNGDKAAALPTISEGNTDDGDIDRQMKMLLEALAARHTSNGDAPLESSKGSSNGTANARAVGEASALIESISSWSCRSEAAFGKCVRSLSDNEPLVAAIVSNLTNPVGELNGAIYRWFFEWYKVRSKEARRFVLRFVPLILWNYLSGVAHNDTKVSNKAEACILGIYNTEATGPDGAPLPVKTFTPQSLLRPSIYHEATGPSLTLTETALAQHESSDQPVIVRRPLQQLTAVSTDNRSLVVSFVLSRLNACLNAIPESSLEAMCRVYERIVSAGCPFGTERPLPSIPSDFPNGDFPRLSEHPRISLDSRVFQEMLVGVYQCVYGPTPAISAAAKSALERIHERACHELIVDVTLVTEAIRHSLSLTALNPVAPRDPSARLPLFDDVPIDSIDY